MINKLARRPMPAAAVVGLGLAAGCAGGASDDDRTACAAEPSSDQPAINDPAVEQAGRSVCVAVEGEPGRGRHDRARQPVEWANCAVEVKGSGGAVVELTLSVGDSVVIVDDLTEKVDRLPLIVDKSDEESCYQRDRK